MSTAKPNILLANIDSVTDPVYKMMKKQFICPLNNYAVENAYSYSDQRAALSTVGFFLTTMRNNDEKLDGLRKTCLVDSSPKKHLLKEIKKRGYQTVFASEWPYHPAKPPRPFKMQSPFTEWLNESFDLYIDTHEDQNDCHDIRRLLHGVKEQLQEPYFLVMQVHDTHIPFRSKGVRNWTWWGIECNEILKKHDLNIDALPKLFRDKKFSWCDLSVEDLQEIRDIFKQARQYQVEALKYTLDAYLEFIRTQDNLIFHLIGDHPTFLGEMDYFGNPNGDITLEGHGHYLKTMWLTNQDVSDRSECSIIDFYDIINNSFLNHKIHRSACVDKGAKLGRNICVWHFSHVRETAVLDDDVSLGQNVYVGPNVVIGKGTRVQNNVFIPEGVRIGKNCLIGPSVTFTNDKYPPSDKSKWLPTVVGNNVSLGANSTIVAGVEIGDGCLVGAGSVVTKNIAPNMKAYGNPAREIECLK